MQKVNTVWIYVMDLLLLKVKGKFYCGNKIHDNNANWRFICVKFNLCICKFMANISNHTGIICQQEWEIMWISAEDNLKIFILLKWILKWGCHEITLWAHPTRNVKIRLLSIGFIWILFLSEKIKIFVSDFTFNVFKKMWSKYDIFQNYSADCIC